MGLQFGIKEVLDTNIVDYKTKEPVAFIDYAEASTNEVTGERLKLKGGRGMADQMSFDHSKESTFQLTVPLVDLKLLALITGEELGEGVGQIFKREVLTVHETSGSPSVTLSHSPVGDVKIYKLEGIRDIGEEFDVTEVTSKDVTLATPATNGEEVVAFYQYSAPVNSKRISVKSNKFPKAVSIYGTGLARNQEDEQDYPCHVTVYKARPQQNITFTMSGTEATNLQITFDMFAVTDAKGDGQYIDYIFETETP
ncbi:hypothetical protein [Cytobacillus horneckiae]|uniref:Uncharacterized protein n=1 Tax=Cytobacillus horneckiae TaxID=549687 RepID=A0A2N0ZFA3_9BACI|nr:hypothetical protein [Cytobacillus horneckiae]MEC1155636.1 hypothetical protein [Cytobacillus horneckiae]MED2936954.1 hypothetical protein [Cytobacillus horneckiae]PKG28190.1 hypothetical protein CWS20_15210 [Cytobacillus horneckiae]